MWKRIIRFVNYSDKEQLLTVKQTHLIDNLYKSNAIEETGEVLKDANCEWEIKVKPYEILTLGCSK